jgi:ABC-type glycerol-3-phosphate transport system substrate-binding protein
LKNNYSPLNKCILCLVLAILLIDTACSRIEDNPDRTILTFAIYENQAETMQSIVDSYEEKKGSVKIQLVPLKPAQVLEPSGLSSLADVIYLEGINPADSNGFLDLRPFLDQQTDFDAEDFWQGELDACANTADALNGLPISVSPMGIFYDSQELNSRGVSNPKAGWSWNDFRQTVNQYYQSNPGEPVFIDSAVTSLLDPILDASLRTGQSTNELSEAVAWYVQMALEEKIYPIQVSNATGQTSQEDWIQRIDSGRAILWIDSLDPGIPGPDRQDGTFVPFPVENDQDRTSPAIVSCAGISAGSQHAVEAWEWLDYLSHQNVSAEPGIHQPLPARPSVAEAAGTWSGLEKGVKNAIEFALNHAWYRSNHPNFLAALREAVVQSIQTQSNLAQALAAVASNPPIETNVEAAPMQTPAVVHTPVPTSQSEQITIQYLANWGSNKDFVEQIIALIPNFEAQNPNIRVDYQAGFNSEEGDVIHNLAEQYDCFTYYTPGWDAVPETDLVDLQPLMDQDPPFADDFPSEFLDLFRLNGKLYALPADTDLEYMTYDTDLLKEKGLALPDVNWTLDDLIRLATQLATSSADKPIFGFAAGTDFLLRARGVEVFDTSGPIPKASFNTPEMASTLDWIQSLYTSKVFLPMYGAHVPDKPANYLPYEQAIADEQVGIWVSGAMYIGNGDEYPFDHGYVPIPTNQAGQPLAVISGVLVQGHYISSHSKYPEACWQWIRYLSDQQPSPLGGISPRVSGLSSKNWIARVGENQADVIRETLVRSVESTISGTSDPRLQPYQGWLSQSITAVLQGQDTQVVLAEAQHKADLYAACLSEKTTTGLGGSQIYNQVASPCMQQAEK